MQHSGMVASMRPPGTPEQLQKRREYAIELLKGGQSPGAVARAVGANRSSVWRWHRCFEEAGQAGLSAKAIAGRPPLLETDQRQRLIEILLAGPVAAGYRTELWTLNRITKLIKQKFGVAYHPGHVWRVLGQLGWSCQKPERRALQRDEDAIAHWKRYVWPQVKKRRNAWAHTLFFSMKVAFC